MTTITRRGLYERAMSLFGRRIAYESTTAVNERLGQQTAAVYSLHQQRVRRPAVEPAPGRRHRRQGSRRIRRQPAGRHLRPRPRR
ncbi:hypothetical protein [Streptomyces sp. NEAU-174]|uniref:hypothetical protein n=1 Tax=Streptomyces sp. NEAU-174 TaxID=3458254 RepID=UPI004043A98B